MTGFDKKEPSLDLPELLPLEQITLPPAAKQLDELHSLPSRPVVKAAPVEDVQPFPLIQAQFPRIAEAIHLLWGHVELEDYLQKLIVADRTGREGFPAAIHAALLKLYNQHTSLFKFVRKEDIWSHDPTKKHRLV